MRMRLAILAVLVGLVASGLILAQEPEKPAPKELVYETKNGTVTFNHEKHTEAAGGDCKTCHPAPFKQEKGALGYKDGMHKKAEAAKASCAACHVAGGKAFESKANCAKCHAKKQAAS